MCKRLSSSLFVLALLSGPAVFADEPTTQPAAEPAELTIVTPEQVLAWIGEGACTPVDANGDETRSNLGTLPGALLLTDAGATVETLGDDMDRALVFYCGSERCSAAPSAARAAVALGYTNVSVMSAGIRGWIAAGYEAAPVAADAETAPN